MSIRFDYDPFCLLDKQEVIATAILIEPEIQRLRSALTSAYSSQYAFINLPSDHALQEDVLALAHQKKQLGLSAMVVIGIGGSNLGALALHEAIHGKLSNELNPLLKCYWADTIDPDYISSLHGLVKRELEQKKRILIVIVSKSGLTTEVDANASYFMELLKQFHAHDYHHYCVIITDKDSLLWHYAQQAKLACLEIPPLVGGRYSVMSAAGLFPAAILGIDIRALCKGAQTIIDEMARHSVNTTSAVSAAILALHYKQGIRVHDTFLFSPELESLGKWYRQLLAESIGKEYNRAGQRVNIGLTPTISIGSNDLHSVAQRYLAGPRISFTTFVSVAHLNREIRLEKKFLVTALQQKTFSGILNAILTGTQRSYQYYKLAYAACTLENKHEETLGQFMQWKMLETIYVGFLLGVNPFDQPHVEHYKKETRKILAHE